MTEHYLDTVIENIKHSLNIVSENTGKLMDGEILVSIHIQSNKPQNLKAFLDNIEETVIDHSLVEVIVKIDDDDLPMNEYVKSEINKRPFCFKYVSTPLIGGFFELWSSMNEMLAVCNRKAYFLLNTSDELRILNKGWDQLIKKYVRLFPDDLYRLRSSSQFRFRGYHDYWECGFAPETLAFNTQRWIRVGGDWNPCLGPDTFQQCVAYYFSRHDRFYKHKFIREIPINELKCAGEEAYVGLEGMALFNRLRGAFFAWYRLMSYKVQTDASRRAQKLHAHIYASENNIDGFIIQDNGKDIILLDKRHRKIRRFRYRLPKLMILKNYLRFFNYYFYAGAGYVEEHRSFPDRMVRIFLTICPQVMFKIQELKKRNKLYYCFFELVKAMLNIYRLVKNGEFGVLIKCVLRILFNEKA